MSRQCWVFALIAVVATGLACKKDSESEQSDTTRVTDADLSAIEILGKTRRAYRDAHSYADHGEFILRYDLNGQPRQENHSYELAFRRPNQLHLRLFNTSLLSDGKEMAFAVNDPATNHMDQQVIVHPAGDTINLSSLYQDPIVSFFSAGGAEIPVSPSVQHAQLELAHPALSLLAGKTQSSWFGAATNAKRIDDKKISGEAYYRVEIESTHGAYIAWIDPESWLIRRLEFPTSLLDPALTDAPEVRNLAMVADLKEAEFGPGLAANAFDYQLPVEVHQVRHFVSLPEAFPSELIGRTLRPFQISILGGQLFDEQRLRGHTTAILFFSSDPICESAVRQFGLIREKIEGSAPMQLLAVSTDPVDTTNDIRLLELVRRWGCQEPVARADQDVGLGVFDVRALPTVIVVDGNGTIQFFRTITDGKLETELVAVVNRVRRGDDVAQEMRDDYQRYLDEYANQLLLASADAIESNAVSTNDHLDDTYTSIPNATIPESLELEPAWSRSDFTSAGNILPFRRQDELRFAVLDGFQTIVELDAQGDEIGRTTLDLQGNAGITRLRETGQGGLRAFVGTTILGQAIWTIDSQWRVTGRIPNIDVNTHAGFRDFRISNRGETAEVIAAFWRDQGVVLYSLDGQPVVANDTLAQVNSAIAFESPDSDEPHFLIAGNDGVLRVLDQNLGMIMTPNLGDLQPTHVLPAAGGRFASQANPANPSAASQWRALALAPIDDQTTNVVAFDNRFQMLWQQSITTDAFAHEIEFIGIGPIEIVTGEQSSTTTCCFVARPNGVIHLVALDGSWAEKLSIGFPPTGIRLVPHGNRTQLIVSHERGISSWSIRRIPSLSESSSTNELNR